MLFLTFFKGVVLGNQATSLFYLFPLSIYENQIPNKETPAFFQEEGRNYSG